MEEQSEGMLIEDEKTIYEIDSECIKKHKKQQEDAVKHK